jgi:DUF1009 family protein
MLSQGEKIGLIAGRGAFPMHFAMAAASDGHPVMALAIEGFASPDLEQHVDEIHWLGVGQLDTLVSLCHQSRVQHLAMVGQIDHGAVFNPSKIEPRAFKLLAKLNDRRAQSIASVLIEELKSENISVLDSSHFLKDFLPEPGLLTPNRPITTREQNDIDFGLPLARSIAGLDIGLCVVVKDGTVVAVEALEGTDETILRAGRLAGPASVVVKVSRPSQDFRFDLPVVGLQTVRSLVEAGASAMAISAGETLFFDRQRAVQLAEESDIGIIAIAAPQNATTDTPEETSS